MCAAKRLRLRLKSWLLNLMSWIISRIMVIFFLFWMKMCTFLLPFCLGLLRVLLCGTRVRVLESYLLPLPPLSSLALDVLRSATSYMYTTTNYQVLLLYHCTTRWYSLARVPGTSTKYQYQVPRYTDTTVLHTLPPLRNRYRYHQRIVLFQFRFGLRRQTFSIEFNHQHSSRRNFQFHCRIT